MNKNIWVNIRLKGDFTSNHDTFMKRMNSLRRPEDLLGDEKNKWDDFLSTINTELGLKFYVEIDSEHNSVCLTEDGWVDPGSSEPEEELK